MVLLSQLEDQELELRMRHIDLIYTINDRIDYLRRIKQARKHRYAVNFDETVSGVYISAPIIGYVHPAVISICGPFKRMQSKTKYYVKILTGMADYISKRLQETFRAKSRAA
jgi:DNA-binding IclR family transcriptional regulator